MPVADFSIVITCHNQQQFIQDAVSSAVSQSGAEKEVIVVDDASTDASPEVLQRYGKAIRYCGLQQNQGANYARNHGASVAGGKYLVFLDGDDLFLPWALRAYARIVQEKQPKVILAQLLFFKGAPPLEQQATPGQMELAAYESVMRKDRTFRASASATVVERAAFAEVGGWSEDIFPMEDVDIVAKLGYSGKTIQVLSPATVAYRMHAGNSVHTIPPFIAMIERMVQKEKAGGYPGGRAGKQERRAFLGGPIAFWVGRTLEAKMYRACFTLVRCGWQMILASLLHKVSIRFRGKRPLEIVEL